MAVNPPHPPHLVAFAFLALASAACDGREQAPCDLSFTLDAEESIEREVAAACDVSFTLGERALLEITASAEITLDGEAPDEAGWVAPRPVEAGTHRIVLGGPGRLALRTYGAPFDSVRHEQAITWTQAALLDDPTFVSLGRVLRLVADDAGALFDRWLRRFGSTAHSERLGPTQLLDAIAAEQGADPSAWNLDALPFVVTAVHNRIDLANDQSCGELRVSFGSVHDAYQPFHLIFLFAQTPGAGDRSPGGRLHCAATARRWARLSRLDEAAFALEARARLAEGLTRERFLLAESAEFISAPWEWRQWFLESGALENRPLFQAVDIPRLNAAGPDRTEFLEFVTANAAALDARMLLLPERFRSPSARANAGVPWVPLELDGVDAAVLASYPRLRQHIEIVGCPACHAIDGDFVQTEVDRSFSPFYDKELPARAAYLTDLANGERVPVPFGPLQPDPVLPP